MRAPKQQSFEVTQASDAFEATQAAKVLGRALGFDARTTEEVAIAVSELAGNLVKYARRGRLTLEVLHRDGRTGMQIESQDCGPGIPDVEKAMTDGFSTAGSLGYGLGAVNRLMDEMEIKSGSGMERGTHIVCRRWLAPAPPLVKSCPLDFGVATRPYPGKDVNGDAFVIEHWNGSALVAVIDGLGHGQLAYQAALPARQYVETHLEQPLRATFEGVGRSCRGTQGVVMAIARIDWRLRKLSMANVGNVEARFFGSAQPVNFMIRRGVIGLNAPNPVVTEHRWDSACTLVLHSDGLKSHWRWEDLAPQPGVPASVIAQRLLRRQARDDDDVTVVVVKGKVGH